LNQQKGNATDKVLVQWLFDMTCTVQELLKMSGIVFPDLKAAM
jgi:hypothetical protein